MNDDASALLEGLDAEKEAVITHPGGPLIVLAGPGTGKTFALTRRIAWLIRGKGVDPASILALTFTNAAAREMRERLAGEDAVGPGAAEQIGAMTFNSFGMNILQRHGDVLGLPPKLDMIDSAQRRRLSREIIREQGLFADARGLGVDAAAERAFGHIHTMHCAGLRHEDAASTLDARLGVLEKIEHPTAEHDAEAAAIRQWRESVRLWRLFSSACRSRGWISFDDQITLAREVLTASRNARDTVRGAAKYVLVDEFQDVNLAQMELLKLVAPPSSTAPPNIFIVGDDDQAIYGFRGSDDRAIERFDRIWSAGTRGLVETLLLESNRRSTQPVLDVANAVIAQTHHRFAEDKIIRRAERPGEDAATPGPVELVHLEGYASDAKTIRTMILREKQDNPSRAWSDFAVIARGHSDLARVRGALELDGIPVRVARPAAPIDDAGVQDVLAWATLLTSPGDAVTLRRVLLRPPVRMERDAVLDLLQRYRAATSRDDTPTPVLAWLDTAIDAGDPNRAAFDRFLGVFNPLRRDTVEQPADAMIERIIESTGVAHAELLARSDRDARIASLVALLRFARERLKRLTEPRDLAAFFEYYNDLDDRDKALRIDAPDPEGIESFQGDDGTGVRLMTGHAAKGLEAETVFVTRVDSQHGFPSRKNRNDESLPACLTPPDEGVAPRTAQQAIDDEERRLFYVACTRARSRLVILGTPPKNKGPNTVNYFCEIRDTPDLAILRTQTDILEGSAADELSGITATLRAGDAYRTRLAHAQRDARDKAARALDNAATPDVTAESLDTIARTLRSSAEHLGVIAAARAGDALPPWAVTTELRSLHSTLQPAEADAEDGDNRAHGLRALAAPLRLSYSMLNAYKRCGRCFYLSHVHRLAESTTSSLLVGAAAHAALEKFAHVWQHAEGDGLPTPGVETLAKIADDALLALVPATEAVDPLQREQLRAQMHHAIEDFAGPTTEIRDTELDIKTNYHCDGVDHRLTAKIDRYDQIGNAYRIIDYKTGKPSESKLMPKADDLQFALYTIALADHLNMPSPDDLIGTAEYWVLSTGERGRVKLEDIAARLPRTRKAIDTLIAGILAGAYKQGTPGYGCSGACNAFFGE